MLHLRSESGAVLVHTAVAMIGLLAFSAFSIDYGVLWVSRQQAQNSADAAALAGAISFTLATPGNPDRARAAAVVTGLENGVWGEPPAITAGDVQTGAAACPFATSGLPDTCVRANVFRNQERGNALPTFFARLMGVTTQGVRATATAQVRVGNSATCARPWAIPDRWLEARDLAEEYDRYASDDGDPLTPALPVDEPLPLGYQPDVDTGLQLSLTIGNPDAPITATPPRLVRNTQFFPIALDPVAVDDYAENIRTCHSDPIRIGDTVTTKLVGEVPDPDAGVDDLILQDDATWSDAENRVVRACEPACSGKSPRVVPVVIYDAEQFHLNRFAGGAGGGRYNLVIKNITCLFVEQSGDVVGRIVPCPGTFDSTAGAIDPAGAFLRSAVLVR
jgi:Flp pilus assembly protein TadG